MSAAPIVKKPASSSTVLVHPLVLLNIVDHGIRSSSLTSSASAAAVDTSVCGMMFGVQSGLNVEVFTSVEMIIKNTETGPVIDDKFVNEQKDLITKVFPSYELLGWYSCGLDVSESHVALHTQMSAYNESPIFLLINPNGVSPDAKELPVNVFISDYHGSALILSRIPYKIETTESERVTVDFIANRAAESSSQEGSSEMVKQLKASGGALKMLAERLGVIESYLRAVKSGEIQSDRAILRQISSLASSIPVVDSSKFSAELASDYNDTLMLTYLASIAHGTEASHDLLDKVKQAGFSKEKSGGMPGRRRGMAP